MRKLSPEYVRRGAYVNPAKVLFQQALPLKLRNRVSGKGGGADQACCVQEMTILLACMKKNNFEESMCPGELSNFQKCYSDSVKLKREEKLKNTEGTLTPGETRLSYRQANELLKKFPLK